MSISSNRNRLLLLVACSLLPGLAACGAGATTGAIVGAAVGAAVGSGFDHPCDHHYDPYYDDCYHYKVGPAEYDGAW